MDERVMGTHLVRRFVRRDGRRNGHPQACGNDAVLVVHGRRPIDGDAVQEGPQVDVRAT